jgi:hypothetical protein
MRYHLGPIKLVRVFKWLCLVLVQVLGKRNCHVLLVGVGINMYPLSKGQFVSWYLKL